MNILFLSSWYPFPPDNGSRLRAYYLLQGLGARHTITLVAFTDEDQPSPPVTPPVGFAKKVVTFPRRVYEPGRASALIGLLSSKPRAVFDTFDARVNETIQALAASDKFDAVVACQQSMAVYAQGLDHPVKLFDEAEPGVFADAYLKATGARRLRNGLTWLKFARFFKTLAAHFHGVTVVSANEKVLLEGLGIPAAKVELVPNGVDCAASAAIRGDKEPYSLIYNGSLAFSANLDAMRYFVREILPLIQAREPGVRLRITGRAGQVAQKELSEDNAVSFTGYMDDVRPLVHKSAVCVVPLRQGGGTRLKILEAMALGTAVVSTTKGAQGLNVRHGEHLLLADTPQEFASATLRLLNDAELCARLVSAARKLVVEEYDWSKIQRTFDVLLERIAAPSGLAR